MKLSQIEIERLKSKYSHLVNYGADDPDAPIDFLTYVDSNGDSLLHIAAQQGDLDTVELLLNAGVDANISGDMGNTALHYARSVEITNLLLAHGASRDICNEFGKKPEVKP